jgi:hypothetical protein
VRNDPKGLVAADLDPAVRDRPGAQDAQDACRNGSSNGVGRPSHFVPATTDAPAADRGKSRRRTHWRAGARPAALREVVLAARAGVVAVARSAAGAG